MAEKTNFVEYAKALFWQDMDAPKVANEMLAAGASKSAVKAIFQKLLDDGYGFLPGLSKLAASTTDAAHGGFDGSAPNRDEMQRYLTERADAVDEQLLKDEHPVKRIFAPSYMRGQLKDARTGESSVLRSTGRALSDLATDAPAILGGVVGKVLNRVDPWHNYKFADPGDPDGLLRDPAVLTSAAAPFVAPAALAAGARGLEVLGRLSSAGKMAKALEAYRSGSRLAQAGRFAAEAAADAAGAYGASRLSDFTPNYSAAEAAVGGALGATFGRAFPRGADLAKQGADKAAATANRAVLGPGSDVGLQELPAVYKMEPRAVRPKGKADETVRYLTQDLGLGADALPASVLSPKDVRNTATRLEQTLVSSPIGDRYMNRWANLNRILQKRARDLIGDADAYATIENLRRRWPNIAEKVYGEHFNLGRSFEHRPDIAEGLRAAEANQLQALERNFGALGSSEEASEILSRVSAAPNTSAFLESRIKELEKDLKRGSLGSLDSPDMAELDLLRKVKERVQERDITPMQRLQDLDGIRTKIDANILKDPNKKVTPTQAKTLKQIKHFLLDDMEQILGNREWFGDVAETAADTWKSNRAKMRTFGKGARELEQYIAPDRIDAKGLRSRLVNDPYFNESIRTTLEMGGDEGRELLGEMESLALDAALGEEKKIGIPWTSAANKYNATATAQSLGKLLGTDSRRLAEMRTILDAGSRMGSPEEAGSAFARNSGNLLNPVKKASLKFQERMYANARRSALADQGLGKRPLFDVEDLIEREGGIPRGEQVAPVVAKTETAPLITAPEIPAAVRPKLATMGRAVGGTIGRRDTSLEEVPPAGLTETELELWKMGWRPRPEGGFAVD